MAFSSRGSGRRQRGASAVEFALVFPALFMTIYGGIVYGYMFFMQQRINFAVQEGLRAAISTDPAGLTAAGYQAAICTAAQTAVTVSFTAGGGSVPTGLTSSCPSASTTSSFAFQVSYPVAGMFPTVTFPVLGTFPSVPASLIATGEGRLS
jgi:Flp pilus assembly protein TadG